MSIDKYFSQTGRMLKEDGTCINAADVLEGIVARKGFEMITDTQEHTPSEGESFIALQTIADTVFASLSTVEGCSITGNDYTSEMISEGTIIYGRFNSVTLSSGKVIAYKG